jgi:hypothetical protein
MSLFVRSAAGMLSKRIEIFFCGNSGKRAKEKTKKDAKQKVLE